jgi:NADH:ubiquinone reductase (H+-translocating)
VGGGYTGFEAASHIAHYTHCRTGLPFARLREAVEIVIMEKAPVVLGNTRPEIQQWAVRLIESYGVEVRTGVSAASFEEGGAVRMSDGSLLQDAMVVWTAGVAPGPAVASLGAPRLRDGRLEVDPDLRVKGMENVFAAGDAAGALPPKHQRPLRLAWHFSEAGGKTAAENLLRALRHEPLQVYNPRDPGYVIPLAPGHAVGIVLGVDLHGRLPFFFHYLLSVANSQGWGNKQGVLRDLWSEMMER